MHELEKSISEQAVELFLLKIKTGKYNNYDDIAVKNLLDDCIKQFYSAEMLNSQAVKPTENQKTSVKFTVTGKPQGKQRPRICRRNGKVITYTPRRTIEYQQKTGASYKVASKVKFEKDIPLQVHITAFFPIPKSTSKKVKESMLKGEIKPTITPDGDNVIKSILDGLNGVAFYDDCQVCRIYFDKIYAEEPKTVIGIKEMQ